MAKGRALSILVPPVLICSAFLVWRSRQTTRKDSDGLNEDTLNVPLVDTGDEELQTLIFHHAFERGASVLEESASVVSSFDAQVGGISTHKQTFLRMKPAYVLKPLRRDHRKIREIGFYELVNTPKYSTTNLADRPCQRRYNQMDNLRSLHQFMSEYYGIAKCDGGKVQATSTSPKEDDYLILEDLTRKYSKPCIIDVKMGTQSFEPDAPTEKKRKEVEKYPQQGEFGLRIVGMRLYDPKDVEADEKGYTYHSKHYGRSLRSKCQLKESLRAFFGLQRTGEPIVSVLMQLEEIKAWFLENESFCFYSSSIMIVYEGNDECEQQSLPTVKMIDFARVRRKKGRDEGYLVGLQTLITLLREIELEIPPTTAIT